MSDQIGKIHVQSLDDQINLLGVGLVQEVLELSRLWVVPHKSAKWFAVYQLLEVDFLLIVRALREIVRMDHWRVKSRADLYRGRLWRSVIDHSVDETVLELLVVIVIEVRQDGLDSIQFNYRHGQFQWIPVLKIHLINKFLFLLFAVENFQLDLHLLCWRRYHFQFVVLESSKIDVRFVDVFFPCGHTCESKGDLKIRKRKADYCRNVGVDFLLQVHLPPYHRRGRWKLGGLLEKHIVAKGVADLHLQVELLTT